MLDLIRAYQAPATRAVSWEALSEELRAVRLWFSRLWFVFDENDEPKGRLEAVQAADRALTEILLAYPAERRTGVAIYLFNKIRTQFKPLIRRAKQKNKQEPFSEESIPVDESREIEAPEGLTPMAEELWDRKVSPEKFLAVALESKLITKTQEKILRGIADGKNATELGAELGMSALAVRQDLFRARNLLLFGYRNR